MRAFIALDLPEAVRQNLGNLIRELASFNHRVKWCSPGQIHVTLKFFGELPEGQVAAVIGALSGIVAAAPSFEVEVRGTGFFGSGGRIRVIWAGMEDASGLLCHLARQVEDALAPLGFPGEGRPFKPHLTLGRFREPSRDPALLDALHRHSEFTAGKFAPPEVVLYSSTLTPKGPVYRKVHNWPLGGS